MSGRGGLLALTGARTLCLLVVGAAALALIPDALAIEEIQDGTRIQSIGGMEFDTIWSPGHDIGLQLDTGGNLTVIRGNSSQRMSSGVNLSLSNAAWRPDGSYALVVGDGGAVLKFMPQANTFQVIPSGTVANLHTVSWRPDGLFALITGEGGVMLRFDHSTQRVILVPTSVTIGLQDIAWCDDGTSARIRAEDGTTLTYPPVCLPLPQIQLREPCEGDVLRGDVVVRGSVSIESGSVALVEACLDSGPWRSAEGLEDFACAFDTRPHSNGRHQITVRAWSDAGASATASVGVDVQNPYLPPLLGFISPENGATVSGMAQVEGFAAGATRPLERVDLRIDGEAWGKAPGGEYWRLTLDTTTLPNGVHRLSARAWDGASFSIASIFIVVENDPCAPPPVLPQTPDANHPAPADIPIAPVVPQSAPDPGPEAGPEPETRPSTLDAEPRAGTDAPAYGGGAAAVASGVALATLGVALAGERGRFALLQFLFVPLYTRIRRDRVLDNFTRGMIYGFIVSNPGAHYNFIKQKLGLNNGSIVYHLTMLERQELIKSEKVGLYKRFYPVGRTLSEAGVMELDEAQLRLLEVLRESPGLTQKALAQRLGLSGRVVNYHLGLLQRARLVGLATVDGETRCYPTERMPVC
ncbi:MAG: Ig-like domain-containing protein [Thermoplasmatota archaeon]